MASGLIALLDDIAGIAKLAASSLDDVTGAAAKASSKAAGVVIDDAAVTPRYVVGLTPDRELPIIWKIALGSLRNKLLFLLPAAIAISAFAPWALTPLLMMGGSYLCFEAAEKLFEAMSGQHDEPIEDLAEIADPTALEDRQVSGAIRTDFILSGEIIVLTLGTVQASSLATQVAVLAGIAALMTAGVYGLVACIVKLDDAGLYLSQQAGDAAAQRFLRRLGRAILRFAPYLMKGLSVAGTAAMFLVGGGILLHGIPAARSLVQPLSAGLAAALQPWMVLALDAAAGILAGALVLAAVTLLKRLRQYFP